MFTFFLRASSSSRSSRKSWYCLKTEKQVKGKTRVVRHHRQNYVHRVLGIVGTFSDYSLANQNNFMSLVITSAMLSVFPYFLCKRYLCWNFPHCLKMRLRFKLLFYLFRKVFFKGQGFLNLYTFLWPDEGYYDHSYNQVWPGLFWYHNWKWLRTVLFTACTTSDILHLSYSQHIPQKVQTNTNLSY